MNGVKCPHCDKIQPVPDGAGYQLPMDCQSCGKPFTASLKPYSTGENDMATTKKAVKKPAAKTTAKKSTAKPAAKAKVGKKPSNDLFKLTGKNPKREGTKVHKVFTAIQTKQKTIETIVDETGLPTGYVTLCLTDGEKAGTVARKVA